MRNLPALREYDTSYEVHGIGPLPRERVSAACELGDRDAASIPHEVPSLEALGAPAACRMLAEKDRGLVLCVGAAGNGKTSTLAAMVDYMNHHTARHIVTIEDPIEYIYTDDKCSVSQRENRLRHAELCQRAARGAAPRSGRHPSG